MDRRNYILSSHFDRSAPTSAEPRRSSVGLRVDVWSLQRRHSGGGDGMNVLLLIAIVAAIGVGLLGALRLMDVFLAWLDNE